MASTELDGGATAQLRDALAGFIAAILAHYAERLGTTDISQEVSTIEYNDQAGRYQNAVVVKPLPSRALELNVGPWLQVSTEWETLVTLILDSHSLRVALLDFPGVPAIEAGYERWTLFFDFAVPLLARYLNHRGNLEWSEEAFERAFAELEAFIARGSVTVAVAVPLGGFRSDLALIDLGEGVRLQAFADEQKRELWEREFARYPHGWLTPLTPLTIMDISDWTHVLVIEREEPKSRSHGPNPPPQNAVRAILDGRQRRDLAFLALRLLQPGGIWPNSEFTYTPEPTFDQQRRWAATVAARGHGESYRLGEDQVAQLQRIYQRLRVGNLSRLDVALRRFTRLYNRTKPDDRLIDCWIALENLFLPDGGAELSYRVRLRGARYLGVTPDERRQIFRTLRDSYNQRSDLVHGKHEEVSEMSAATEDLVRRALRRAVGDVSTLDVEALDATMFE